MRKKYIALIRELSMSHQRKEAYSDVVLAGVRVLVCVRVLVRVACLGVVVVAVTLFEPGSDDVSDSIVASANALVLHS